MKTQGTLNKIQEINKTKTKQRRKKMKSLCIMPYAKVFATKEGRPVGRTRLATQIIKSCDSCGSKRKIKRKKKQKEKERKEKERKEKKRKEKKRKEKKRKERKTERKKERNKQTNT